MSKRLTKADLPTSLGSFKPVGHVMVALPNVERALAFEKDLQAQGFGPEDVLHFGSAFFGFKKPAGVLPMYCDKLVHCPAEIFV